MPCCKNTRTSLKHIFSSGGNIQLVPLCTLQQLPTGSDSEIDLPKPALLKPRRSPSVPAARPTCGVPCSEEPLCSENRGISLCPLPVGAPRCQHITANNDPVKHLLMSAGRRQEALTQKNKKKVHNTNKQPSCLCSLHFLCNQSTSSSLAPWPSAPAPTSLLSLQLSISWQNIAGKFHGWWQRCENVTPWAINKEVWV